MFSLVKLFFFFVCELLLIDKPMVTSEPAVTSAQLLGLGSKLYHSNMQHMLNEDNTRFIQSPSRVRQNRGSERKAVLAGTVRAPQFTLQTSAQQTRDRKRIKKKNKKFIVYSSGPLIDYTDVLMAFLFYSSAQTSTCTKRCFHFLRRSIVK